ncbi:MAG: gliding motility-associated C-terminal domain-containing protein [Flavobacteriales bacterium]
MKLLFFVFFCFWSVVGHCQNEWNSWYFGSNAGLNFNTTPVSAYSNGNLMTVEGCASISEALTGTILFYTNGENVYNANHVIMPNGTGLTGHNNSTQSTIIVKKPGFTNIYGIFTTDTWDNPGGDGFRYSEVDMTLDGGLGDVTSVKNVLIFGLCGEKVTAIQHGNDLDYWLVIHDHLNDNLISFPYTAAGIGSATVSSPILGNIGTVWGSRGYMKANGSGTKLACMYSSTGDELHLNDFDNLTGIISNPIIISRPRGYGVEFSPNEKYLYVSCENPTATGEIIFQYDIEGVTSSTDLLANEVIVASTTPQYFKGIGALQLGPDGRIYTATLNTNSVGLIENPNLGDTNCNFIYNEIPLEIGTMSYFGLPNYKNNFWYENNVIFDQYDTICEGESLFLDNIYFTNSNWAIDSNPMDIISTDSSILVNPVENTNYILFDGTDTLTFFITVLPPFQIDLGPDICDTTGTISLNLQQSYQSYLWSNDSTTNSIDVSESGIYWVEVSNNYCTTRDSIFIQIETLTIESSLIIECDSIVDLSVNDSNMVSGTWTYLGPPGSIGLVTFSPNAFVKDPIATIPILGEYIFIYTSDCGHEVIQTVNFVSKAPELNIETSIQCDFEIDLVANNPINNGIWTVINPLGDSTIIADVHSPNTTATVTGYGEYTFTYTYDFCETSYSQTVNVQSIPPKITTDTTFYVCDLEMSLSAQSFGHTQGWEVLYGPGILNFSDVSSNNTLVNVTDYGTYTIVFHACGGKDTIDLTFEKSEPVLSSPKFVECGLQALIEVAYFGESGEWAAESENGLEFQLDIIDSTQIFLTSNEYGIIHTTYTVCDTSISTKVVFMCELEIPNVFTPNNDLHNPLFIIPGLSSTFYSKSNFTIFNRWGINVYQNGNYGLHNSWWDGKSNNGSSEDLLEGVYFYELSLFNKIKEQEEVYKGTIHLFR